MNFCNVEFLLTWIHTRHFDADSFVFYNLKNVAAFTLSTNQTLEKKNHTKTFEYYNTNKKNDKNSAVSQTGHKLNSMTLKWNTRNNISKNSFLFSVVMHINCFFLHIPHFLNTLLHKNPSHMSQNERKIYKWVKTDEILTKIK